MQLVVSACCCSAAATAWQLSTRAAIRPAHTGKRHPALCLFVNAAHTRPHPGIVDFLNKQSYGAPRNTNATLHNQHVTACDITAAWVVLASACQHVRQPENWPQQHVTKLAAYHNMLIQKWHLPVLASMRSRLADCASCAVPCSGSIQPCRVSPKQ
jgi:hypothetical protein